MREPQTRRTPAAAWAVIVAAYGWVASTTASTFESTSQRRIPSTPPNPPMRTSPTGSAGSGTRPASELITSTSGCSRAASVRASEVPPSSSTRISAVLPPRSARRVQVAVREALGGQHVADDDHRGPGDVGRMHLVGESGQACTAAPSAAASSRTPPPHRGFRRGSRLRAAAGRSRRPVRRPGAAPASRPAPTTSRGPPPAASPSTASRPASTSRSARRRER